MEYRVYYVDKPGSRDFEVEAPDHRAAAQQFFSQRPRSEHCRIGAESINTLDYRDFDATEFMDEATRASLPPLPAWQPTPESTPTGYIDQYLMPGENVVYRTRLHWAVFLPPLAWFIFAVGLFFTGLRFVGALLLVFAVFPLAITSFIARATSEFAITNKRVLIKTGWISRHSLETLLSKVEGIRVEQSILGRMWDYGTIVVSGTGGSKEPFRRIASPMQFRREVQEQIAAIGGG